MAENKFQEINFETENKFLDGFAYFAEINTNICTWIVWENRIILNFVENSGQIHLSEMGLVPSLVYLFKYLCGQVVKY